MPDSLDTLPRPVRLGDDDYLVALIGTWCQLQPDAIQRVERPSRDPLDKGIDLGYWLLRSRGLVFGVGSHLSIIDAHLLTGTIEAIEQQRFDWQVGADAEITVHGEPMTSRRAVVSTRHGLYATRNVAHEPHWQLLLDSYLRALLEWRGKEGMR